MADQKPTPKTRTAPASKSSTGKTKLPSAGNGLGAKFRTGLIALGAAGAGAVLYSNFPEGIIDRGEALPGQHSSEFQRPGTEGFRIAEGEAPTSAALPQTSAPQPVDETGPLRSTIADLEAKIAALEANPEQVIVADEAALNDLRIQLEGVETDLRNARAETLRQSQEVTRLRTQIETDALLAEQNRAEDQAEQARRNELERRRAARQQLEDAQNNSSISAIRRGSSAQPETGDLSRDDAFVRAGAGTVQATRAQVISNPSNTVVQGTIIEAALETGISSDLQGNIAAIISYDVWAFDLSRVLIPRGSKLFGRYSSDVSVGQKRVLVAWDRVVTPDGQSAVLDAYGSDRLGRSGLTGRVDNHFLERFGSAALISVIGATPAVVASNTSDETTANVLENVGDDFSGAVDSTISEFVTRQPTITVEHGDKVTVIVNADVEFF